MILCPGFILSSILRVRFTKIGIAYTPSVPRKVSDGSFCENPLSEIPTSPAVHTSSSSRSLRSPISRAAQAPRCSSAVQPPPYGSTLILPSALAHPSRSPPPSGYPALRRCWSNRADSHRCSPNKGTRVTILDRGCFASCVCFDPIHVVSGGVFCHPDYPVCVSSSLELKILVLDIAVPILPDLQFDSLKESLIPCGDGGILSHAVAHVASTIKKKTSIHVELELPARRGAGLSLPAAARTWLQAAVSAVPVAKSTASRQSGELQLLLLRYDARQLRSSSTSCELPNQAGAVMAGGLLRASLLRQGERCSRRWASDCSRTSAWRRRLGSGQVGREFLCIGDPPSERERTAASRTVSAIPYELYTEIMHEIGSCELEDIDVVIHLANRETISPIGIVRDVEVLCDCKKEKILTKFAGEPYEFNFSKFTKTPYKADLPSNDFKMEQCASIVLVPDNPLQQHLEDSESEIFRKERDELEEIFLRQPILKHDLPVEDLGTTPPPKEDPVFDLKPLPDNLKYAYIDDKKIYPVIISSKLTEFEEERLLQILKKHRGAIGYTLDDLKGISPSICQHAINMEDDAKPVVEPQRRLIPKMKDVVRNEVLRLLEAGIIYPIADSRWVSPVHCVPKKGGMTVVPNDNDELIPQRVVSRSTMVSNNKDKGFWKEEMDERINKEKEKIASAKGEWETTKSKPILVGSVNTGRSFSHNLQGALPPALDLDSFPCVEEAIRVADEFCDQYRALKREVEILQEENQRLRRMLEYYLIPSTRPSPPHSDNNESFQVLMQNCKIEKLKLKEILMKREKKPSPSSPKENPSKEIFSELDETFACGPIFARSFQKTEDLTKWGHEVAEARPARPSPGRADLPPGPLVWPLALTFRLLKAPVAKPPVPRATIRKTLQRRRRRESHLGDSGDRSGTLPERGFISRRTLHRHDRLRSDE
ncbi:hypothetical protein QYE76_052218 [Lolium multiflorum]|uniref:Uncharacterized protein n=1 Tax=Lolium multiflorum TaxID=4521 RepID=A0AAD8WJ00_LOLMU|nr:hypothetical protein QYE76_052218 [Lolium multiflorum]